MRPGDVKSPLLIVGHLALYHCRVDIAAFPCPRRRGCLVGQGVDNAETCPRCRRLVENILVCDFRFCLIRIEKNGVAVFPAIQEVFDHAPEWRHADTAGDEHKPLTLVARKREVTRDAPRKYGTSGYKVGKCLFLSA